ncbi:energy-coupling factor transporter ATPase [Heliophilum fasciatum]|uniref:Energy-coupling factor transporter ATP-binding protein EcfA2 n=1 Tax=Heliophilum fasciatum TaxID=35700 RepID=A0A4R2RXK8_9FIRM|nr:energy-coupling factor transporter ATPase [Heliophilum fasciatum]MCW2277785.1 energy-coupling factor transport system ATP-binding protein [Heliophilum fasciatum]TCP64721.1 energy-coupling factor transport system ATP-binding protein [Heliophilum fasciatum]
MPITLRQLTHIYHAGTPMAQQGIVAIDLEITEPVIVAIIGQTGSGKTTLIQHMNGLLKPTDGSIQIDEWHIDRQTKTAVLQGLYQRVGMVFQYPEHQLFEATVYDDIAYGPRNMNLSESEVAERVVQAMTMVGLDPDAIRHRSPLQLSGGQKRRVALAGVLAMRPQKMILDEPTVGLDPQGREAILQLIRSLHETWQMTIILISHNMDDIAQLADRVIVMKEGRMIYEGASAALFLDQAKLLQFGITAPYGVQLVHQLRAKGWPIEPQGLNEEQILDAIIEGMHRQTDTPSSTRPTAPAMEGEP